MKTKMRTVYFNSAFVPLGKVALVEEYRSPIQFLCSDTSSHLNGQNLVIDGEGSLL